MSTPRRPRLLSLLFVAGIALPAAFPARAGVGVWTPLGPDGGTVSAVSPSPIDRTIVFAGSSVGGVFRSGDGGRSWEAVNSGIGAVGFFGNFSCFAFEARRPQVVYAGTYFSGSYRSEDGGRTWSPNAALPLSNSSSLLYSLLADPQSAGTLYAGTSEGVFRSRDGGRSWQARNRALPPGAARALAFDPAGRDLYVGLDPAGVYRSGDRGGRWQRASTGIGGGVTALAFDPRMPGTILAGTTTGLYLSLDAGQRWSQVGTGVIQGSMIGAGFQATKERAFAASGKAVYVSSDHGATWAPVAGHFFDPLLRSFAVGFDALFTAPGRLTGEPALARSDDGGATWRRSDRGLSTLKPNQLAFHPTSPATFYLSTDPGGLFRSRDGGATWDRVVVDPARPLMRIDGVAVEPSHPDTVYAGSRDPALVFLRSDDGGATWRNTGAAPTSPVEVIKPDLRSPGALWAAGFGGAYHSPDGGQTLERIPLTAGTYPWFMDIEVDPLDPRIVTLSGGKLIGTRAPRVEPLAFRTEDGGTSWRELANLPAAASLVLQVSADPDDPDVLYAATYPSLLRSDDGGANWTQKLDFKVRGGAVVATPEALYAARSGAGILRSTDRGETWTPIRKGLGALRINRLWADPANSRHLFAASETNGLFEYTAPPGE